jgi:hypothetical protein
MSFFFALLKPKKDFLGILILVIVAVDGWSYQSAFARFRSCGPGLLAELNSRRLGSFEQA